MLQDCFSELTIALWGVADPAVQWLIGLAGFAVGLIACLILAVVEYGAWALILPPRGQRTVDDESRNESVPISTVAVDGVKLAGRWFPADEDCDSGRTAILLRGFAESAGSLQAERASALRRSGWNVAVPDLRGYGESGGPFASFGGREAGDVSAWLDSLEARLGRGGAIQPILWGRSMGAAIALRAAAADPRIQALVLESPMVDLDLATAIWFRKRRFPFSRVLARLVTRRASRLVGVSLTRPTALQVAPRVHCPVLILHGADDTLVTVDQARRLASLFPHSAHLVELEGAGHADVLAIGGEALLAEVTGFVRRAIT
jgi:pimeloyl-ACP methyl ester carboxylesterase